LVRRSRWLLFRAHFVGASLILTRPTFGRLGDLQIDSNALLEPWPWHFVVDENLRLCSVGSATRRRYPHLAASASNSPFDRVCDMEIVRPKLDALSFDTLAKHTKVPFVAKLNGDGLILRGQWHAIVPSIISRPNSKKCLVFLCAPDVVDMDSLTKNGLTLADLAVHDSRRELVRAPRRVPAPPARAKQAQASGNGEPTGARGAGLSRERAPKRPPSFVA
jgi:hypothetical protein